MKTELTTCDKKDCKVGVSVELKPLMHLPLFMFVLVSDGQTYNQEDIKMNENELSDAMREYFHLS